MKTTKIYLAGLLIIGFFGVSVFGNSQDSKPDKKSRKEAKRAAMELNFRTLDSLLYSGSIFIEYLQNKYGNRVFVPSSLDFVRVEYPQRVCGQGSNTGMGYNGVGGVTAEGTMGIIETLIFLCQFQPVIMQGPRFLVPPQADLPGMAILWNLDNSRAFKGIDAYSLGFSGVFFIFALHGTLAESV